jgi:hypothetical protein
MKAFYFFSGEIQVKTIFGGINKMSFSGVQEVEGTPEYAYSKIEEQSLKSIGIKKARVVFNAFYAVNNLASKE